MLNEIFLGMERIEKLKTFLQINPLDSFVQHALALEYVKIGDDSSARKLFEELLGRDPSYVGSYYHLGKLLERNNALSAASQCYQKGLEAAKRANDRHAFNELQNAYDELTL